MVGARLLIKDPEPPKAADHSHKPFRALPGVLDNIPVAEQSKISPEILAQLKEANRRVVVKKATSLDKFFKDGSYVPADVPTDNVKDQAVAQEFQYQYVRRQKIIDHQKELERAQALAADPNKKVLVLFKSGRHIKARNTYNNPPFLAIQVDTTMTAGVNRQHIQSVTDNAATWQEPVPAGKTRLKPAKGITITVDKKVAERITISDPIRNES